MAAAQPIIEPARSHDWQPIPNSIRERSGGLWSPDYRCAHCGAWTAGAYEHAGCA